MVPAAPVVPMETTAIIPTLGRETLADAMASLEKQSAIPKIIVKTGDGDTLIKIKEAVNEATTETVIIADDDAQYPEKWIENLSKSMTPKTGFVGGPCLPLIDADSNDAEKCIAEVTASWFGTSNMSYRYKKGTKTKDADETNLIGNGLYRRDVLAKILNADFDKIPPAAWETFVFTRIRQMGFRTLYNPQGLFYHKQRTNLMDFGRQIFRSGMGRINFFKQFPAQLFWKFHILFPFIFTIYLICFFFAAFLNIPISNIPLIAYVAILALVSFGFNKHKSRRLPFFYLTMHFSYGLGMLFGLFKNERTWT